jgi:molybdopterin-containing oxidoreductase family membrane subunit
VTYAAILNVFFLALEFFTAFYSNVPGHMHTLQYLFAGLDGHNSLVPFMWLSVILGFTAIGLLLTPSTRDNYGRLFVTCIMLFMSLWIDKGIGLVIGGFIPNPLEQVREYSPTGVEIMVTIGIWAFGALILSYLYKIAIDVKLRKEIQ